MKDSLLLYRRPYTGKGNAPETPEFIIRVRAEQFSEWKKGGTTPLADVVTAWEVFVASNHRSHHGTWERPSHEQLNDAFGSHKFEDVFQFMAKHGHLHHEGVAVAVEGHQHGGFMETKQALVGASHGGR